MNSTPLMPDDQASSDGDAVGEPTEQPDPSRFRWVIAHPDGIVTGLSAHLAERLSIDPLWVRLSFVGTALLGGLGVFVYVGLWLALIVARSTPLRVVGAAIAIGSFLVLTRSDLEFMTGPIAVIALLAGLAVTLWKPVPTWAADPAAPNPPRAPRLAPTFVRRPHRPSRPPSLLGRTTLGVSLIVAAVGALIDELNGGRLHPEQWIGAAAMICGLGLLVGTVRGHARWLIVPALALAVLGYGGGVMARIGVQPSDAFTDSYVWVGDPNGPYSAHTGFGSAWVQATEVPSRPVTVDVRTADGMELQWNPDVAVEIRSLLGDVTIRQNGIETVGSDFRIGPDGLPDVVIDLRMARGEIRVTDISIFEQDIEAIDNDIPPTPITPERIRPDGSPLGPIAEVADGVAVTNDGWIILNGDIILDEFNNVIFGDWFSPDEQSVVIPSEIGDYRIVGPVIFTPSGEYFDLDQLRQQGVAAPPVSAPSSPVAPVPADDLDVPPTTTIAAVSVNDQNGTEG